MSMSLSGVHGALSNLKLCQADIGTGMEIVTDVALDLAEAQGNDHTRSHEFTLTLIMAY